MTATVFRQSYMTLRPSLFTLINYCAIVFSFALMFVNCWFTVCDGFYGASACWRSHMKQQTITITRRQGNGRSLMNRGGARHFHLGGPCEGPVLQQGELSIVCVGLSEDLKNFGGAVSSPGTPLAPPLLMNLHIFVIEPSQ